MTIDLQLQKLLYIITINLHCKVPFIRMSRLAMSLSGADWLPWPLGSITSGTSPFLLIFELHIEQGRRLEDARKKIGCVNAIQKIRWYTVTVRGEKAHAGVTSVMHQADAVVAMSKVMVKLVQLALEKVFSATVG